MLAGIGENTELVGVLKRTLIYLIHFLISIEAAALAAEEGYVTASVG